MPLHNFSFDQLKLLRDNEAEFFNFIKEQDAYKQAEGVQTEIIENNTALAGMRRGGEQTFLESNIDKEKRALELKEALKSLQSTFETSLKSLRPSEASVSEDLRYELTQCTALSFNGLQAESEELLARFQRGELSIDDFLANYRRVRQKYHGSRYIHEKLATLFNEQE